MDLSSLILPIAIFVLSLLVFRTAISAYGGIREYGRGPLILAVLVASALAIAVFYSNMPKNDIAMEEEDWWKSFEETNTSESNLEGDKIKHDDVREEERHENKREERERHENKREERERHENKREGESTNKLNKDIKINISSPEEVNIGLNDASPLELLTWEDFKEISQSREFRKGMVRSIKEACKIKLSRYATIGKDNNRKSGGGSSSLSSNIQSDEKANTDRELQAIKRSLMKSAEGISEREVKARMRRVMQLGSTVVGREDVKDFLAQQIVAFSRNPRVFLNNFQNVCVFGPSGVGKTKLATTLSEIYAASGILSRNNFVKTTKADFTTAYVNESGKITRSVLMRGLEGVIFIDEAYDMASSNQTLRDHGNEAITEMVNHLDKYIGLTVVVAGGYESEMRERFLGANEGMDRRFFHKITLSNYSSQQLFEICKNFLRDSGISLNNGSAGYLWGCIDRIYAEDAEIFDRQASDMLSLAGMITHITYSSKGVGDFTSSHREVISGAIAKFTRAKGNEMVPEV